MMSHKPQVSLVASAAIAAALTLAGLPLRAQVSGGTVSAQQAGDLSHLTAAAKAEFSSLLAKALSPENIQAILRLIKDVQIDTTVVTNFDDVNAPCLFEDTTPLRGREQSAGFLAPKPDGGAILNNCSGFGIAPHSPPNFLAFNNTSAYLAGGVPKTPELIFVGQNRSTVSLWVSGGSKPGFPLGVVAFGNGGVQGVVTTVTNSVWAQVTLTGTEITAILLVGNPLYLVVDDITAQ
jgi:hypothetical protein